MYIPGSSTLILYITVPRTDICLECFKFLSWILKKGKLQEIAIGLICIDALLPVEWIFVIPTDTE